MDPQTWIQTNWPNCKALDENWTFARYDYPENVRQWIRDNWVKVSDENGGTYYEPHYHMEKFPNMYKQQPREETDKKTNEKKEGQEFAKEFKKTSFYDGMDEVNKKATDVRAEQGMEAAIEHMFTDQQTGHKLSYAEMRSMYG